MRTKIMFFQRIVKRLPVLHISYSTKNAPEIILLLIPASPVLPWCYCLLDRTVNKNLYDYPLFVLYF